MQSNPITSSDLTNSDLATNASRDAAQLLYENGLSGIVISMIASSFLVFAFDSEIMHLKLMWWAAMTGLLLIRLADLLWWRSRIKPTEFDGRRSTLRFISGTNLTGILWSAYAVLVILHSDMIEMSTTIITIAAMAGGSATVLAAHQKTAMFYAFILLAPASLCLLLSSSYDHQLLGVLGMCFSVVMVVVSLKSAQFTQKAIQPKNENAELVNHMEAQVEQRTRQIYELSNVDPLTGLYNRTAFLKHLKTCLDDSSQQHASLALLFIDLDGFKKINDTFGHEAGDLILQQSASRLKAQVDNQQLLCRWGGDEFLIAIEQAGEAQALEKARQVIDSLSQEHHTADAILSVSATIGISLSPDHAALDSRLIQYADTAMYHQKKRRPSSACVFNQEMAEQHREELRLKSGLSEAIAKQQFRLVFQPIVASQDSAPAAFEALLRWQFGDQNVPPDQFIGIAEQYGLIQSIGEWVLATACRAAVKWQQTALLPVSVNVSVIQLQDPRFIKVLDKAIADSGIDPTLLYLEITESVFATQVQVISEKIRAIQSRGIKVSIDDFGTGYSSLSVMQDFAVNTVKIDRSFIEKLDSSGYAIVTAVIHAAKLMAFEVVAEGVETEAQKEQLKQIGVPKLQGFYFSKPIEESQIKDYLDQLT